MSLLLTWCSDLCVFLFPLSLFYTTKISKVSLGKKNNNIEDENCSILLITFLFLICIILSYFKKHLLAAAIVPKII